ncbi:hypothetical protein AgCh_016904 [Apium graveolens]
MMLTGNDTSLLAEIVLFLGTYFKIKDLGPLTYFLGLELTRSVKGLYLHQHKYTNDIIKDTGLLDACPSCIPVDQNHVVLKDTSSPVLADVAPYRRVQLTELGRFHHNKPREVLGTSCGKLCEEFSKIRSRKRIFPKAVQAPAWDVGRPPEDAGAHLGSYFLESGFL